MLYPLHLCTGNASGNSLNIINSELILKWYGRFLYHLHALRAVAEPSDTPEDQCVPVKTSPFSVLVDYEDAEDPGTLKSICIRNWLVSERVLSAMTEALANCSHLTSIRLAV